MGRAFRVAKHFLKLALGYVIAVILKWLCNKYRGIWIVSERGVDARDNGYFFYKYLKEQHPEINAWYVIDSKSPDAIKIDALGNRIEHNSFRHYIFYALCEVRISAHAWGGDLPNADYFYKFKHLLGRKGLEKPQKKSFAFVNHGITKDYMPFLCAGSFRPKVFSCGAEPEYKYISSSFGHPQGVVQYTGLARFDNLHHVQTKNQILIMPTFRRWLQDVPSECVRESEYVKAWNTVLNDPRLISELKAYGLKLIFYPHHVMQPHIDFFTAGDTCIEIASKKNYDVQELLIESKLLVTDFSSVFFDVAYMNKPVIYYQFDRNRYEQEHYDTKSGYFSYDSMGFGKVCFEEADLVSEIIKAFRDGFQVDPIYADRTKLFFPLHDTNNCDRIFDKILSCVHEGGVNRKKVIFLQHGIIKDCMPYLFAENTCMDLFICGAEPEYRYIVENFHY